MGQYDIEQALKEKREPMTAEELHEVLGITIRAIRGTLVRMYKHKMVERIKLTSEEAEKKGLRYSGRHYMWVIDEDNEIEI